MLSIYHLRFFELDQEIAVGERNNCRFYLDPYFSQADEFDFIPTGMLLIFYNSMGHGEKSLVVDCTIKRIHHLQLGDVLRIYSEGLDYCIETPVDTVIVDAEERSGDVVSGQMQPAGWLFTVELDVHKLISFD